MITLTVILLLMIFGKENSGCPGMLTVLSVAVAAAVGLVRLHFQRAPVERDLHVRCSWPDDSRCNEFPN